MLSAAPQLHPSIDSQTDGVLVLDRQGVILFASPAACAQLHQTHGELLGACFGIPMVTGAVAHLDVLRPHGDVAALEMRLRETNWDGQPAELCLLREVPERRRALDSHETRLPALLAGSPVAVAVCRDGNLLETNPQWLRLFGYDNTHDLRGRPLLDRIVGEFRTAVAALMLAPSGPERSPVSIEVTGTRRDGSPIPVCVQASPVALPGGPAVAVFFTDLSERHALEERLLQSQRLEAIGRLASGVAHDFNNLLTVIEGYGQMLLDEPEMTPVLRESVDEILRAAESASQLTRQLLTFSRRQITDMRPVDLNAVVRGMEGMLRRMIGEDIEVLTSLDPDLGRVRADAGQLQQVLMNLVVNARDAMPHGGRLTIETSRRAEDGRPIVLTVSDTGCGMDPEMKRRLFEPFFTTKEKDKGTGLGLALVASIVEQSGGAIEVDSEPGRGTAFRVCLPHCEDEVEAGPVSAPARPARGSETILLVEDDAKVRALVTRILEDCGYHVLEAKDGRQAARLCETPGNIIRLLVTDVVLPDRSGHELAGELAAAHPMMKVLYISGYAEDIRRPAAACLTKPFTPAALAAKVREVLDAEA